ncbi:MAG: 4Fe-4S binding protein [Thermoleophilia bacterium]
MTEPTGLSPGTPMVDRDRCKGCGLCVEFCPFGHLHLDEELNVAGYHPAGPEAADEVAAELHPDAEHPAAHEVEGYGHNFAYWCLRCRYCELVCPDAAIRVAGDVTGLEGTGDHEGGGDE